MGYCHVPESEAGVRCGSHPRPPSSRRVSVPSAGSAPCPLLRARLPGAHRCMAEGRAATLVLHWYEMPHWVCPQGTSAAVPLAPSPAKPGRAVWLGAWKERAGVFGARDAQARSALLPL